MIIDQSFFTLDRIVYGIWVYINDILIYQFTNQSFYILCSKYNYFQKIERNKGLFIPKLYLVKTQNISSTKRVENSQLIFIFSTRCEFVNHRPCLITSKIHKNHPGVSFFYLFQLLWGVFYITDNLSNAENMEGGGGYVKRG